MVNLVNKSKYVESVFILIDIFHLLTFVYFAYFVLEKHKLLQIKPEIVIAFFIEFSDHVLEITLFLNEFVFSLTTVLQIYVIVLILMMNRKSFKQAFVELLKLAVHLNWIDVILCIENYALIGRAEFNTLLVNNAFL